METPSNHWLPLTEYALRSGMSISTLRRKIKSNTISYKMEEGRYLIRGDELTEGGRVTGFSSSDEPVIAPSIPAARPQPIPERTSTPEVNAAEPARMATTVGSEQFELLRSEMRRLGEENVLRWKALEARVSGIAKKLDYFSEQMAETKMLVKIFEEKLDQRA